VKLGFAQFFRTFFYCRFLLVINELCFYSCALFAHFWSSVVRASSEIRVLRWLDSCVFCLREVLELERCFHVFQGLTISNSGYE
jgi:hypothetical protein